jgi:hypothetical protein
MYRIYSRGVLGQSRNWFNDIQIIADRFRTDNKLRVKKIFIDETMRQIDGCCDYWLCIAYELNLDAYLMIMHISH